MNSNSKHLSFHSKKAGISRKEGSRPQGVKPMLQEKRMKERPNILKEWYLLKKNPQEVATSKQ
jgi:hypothetical protein